MYRLKYFVATLAFVAVGRAITSTGGSWTWKDWVALPAAFLGATQLLTVFAPRKYLGIMQKPRSAWTEDERSYADLISGSRKWLLLVSFVMCYCAVFVNYGSKTGR